MTLQNNSSSSLNPARALPSYKRPLIDQVHNNWRHPEKHYDDSDDSDDDDAELAHCCDLDSDASFIKLCRAFCLNRKVRRAMIILLVAFCVLYFLCRNFFLPAWRERQALLEGMQQPHSFGQQMPNKLSDIVQVQELSSEYIPGGKSDPDGKRRLIFIGDIHGCKKDLLELLKAVAFDKDMDKIVATGDVVAKGPDSPGVVDTLISLGALSVRGNHEDRILLAAQSHSLTGTSLESTDDPSSDVSATSRGAGLKGEALLEYLKPRHLSYLRSLPLIIHIPALTPPARPAPSTSTLSHSHKKKKHIFQIQHDINVVHAGLVPSVPLSRQDPFSVMNMRSMSPSNHVPSENRKRGIPWERVWNWYNDRIARTRSPFLTWLFGQATESTEASEWWKSWNGLYNSNDEDGGEEAQTTRKHSRPSVVVYGHDSPRGLNLKKWSKGLDSGCVNGDQLTAMVLNAWGQAEIVSVESTNRK